MITFKKSESVTGKFKDIVIRGGHFVDDATGEIINLAEILSTVYGDEPFDIATSQKADRDVTPSEE